MATMTCGSVEGQVSEGFEAVRTAFADNFARRRELGGACSVYQRGQKIVDLWGGVRDRLTGEPWERDTMVIVYSATKGLAAMTLAIAHSRGWLDYEERVSEYWPEFAQHGKGAITVRQLLAHQAGLYALDQPLDRGLVGDLDRLAAALARQDTRVGAGYAAGLSRHHPRVLRERAAAPDRSEASQPGPVLPGRDCHAARSRRLHQAARGHPEFAVCGDEPAHVDRDVSRLPAAARDRRHESTLQYLESPQGIRVAAR